METMAINIMGGIFGIVPLLILISFFKSKQPKYHSLWIYGLAFILLAALLFNVLDSSTLAVMSIEAKEEAVAKELKEVKSNLASWTYIGPAAIAAIGVNLIREFL